MAPKVDRVVIGVLAAFSLMVAAFAGLGIFMQGRIHASCDERCAPHPPVNYLDGRCICDAQKVVK